MASVFLADTQASRSARTGLSQTDEQRQSSQARNWLSHPRAKAKRHTHPAGPLTHPRAGGRFPDVAPPPVPPAGSLRLGVLNLFTRLNVIAYRASGGRLGGRMQKAPVCILHTVGRKSGKRRETPLLYLADGDKVVLVASAGGRETSPSWYHNLRAMDAAEVEILGRRTKMTPRLASAEERAGYWPKLNEIYSEYDAYQARTKREIPVVVMSPA